MLPAQLHAPSGRMTRGSLPARLPAGHTRAAALRKRHVASHGLGQAHAAGRQPEGLSAAQVVPEEPSPSTSTSSSPSCSSHACTSSSAGGAWRRHVAAGAAASGSSRRGALVTLGAALAAAAPWGPAGGAAAAGSGATLTRPSEYQAATERQPVDTTITHAVSLTVGIADRALKKAEERTIGDKSIIPDAEPLGRVVIGLYGNAVPRTVSNFLALVQSGNLEGTTFSRVLAGEYIQAGKQGSKRLGAVEVPSTVEPNPEVSEASAFRLSHYRPGTVSLALGENDEEPTLRQRPDYRPMEFLITTGPGPVPRLDGANIVFGRVLSGMDVVGQVARVPVFGPSPVGNSLAFNSLANAIGDERAATVRRKYGKPLKAVVILGGEVLPAVPQVE